MEDSGKREEELGAGPSLSGEGAPLVAPPVVSEASAGYQAPPPPVAAPRKSSPVGAWIGLGLAFLLIAIVVGIGKMSQKTGVVMGGREMTRAEVDEMADEVGEIAEDIKPGDPFSIDTKKPVKSRIAKKIQEMAVASQKLERDFERASAEVDISVLLSGKKLGTAQGRKESRATLEKYNLDVKEYFESSIRLLDGVEQWAKQEMGRVPESYGERMVETQNMYKKNVDLIKTSLQVVALAEKAKAEYEAKSDQVVLTTDQEIAEYDRLMARVVEIATDIEEYSETITKQRQARLDEELAKLKGP